MSETLSYKTVKPEEVTTWFEACEAADFPSDGGLNISYHGLQIAVFNFTRRNEWFATQNLCPHKKQMILSRGMIGSEGNEPKVACPYHKKTFSLKTLQQVLCLVYFQTLQGAMVPNVFQSNGTGL